MKRFQFMLAFVVLGLAVSPAFAQQGKETNAIRAQIDALQKQLQAIESKPVPQRNVTQIGASRLRARNPGLVVKIYDLGDLFALAPPYSARKHSDLGKDSQTLFPDAPGSTAGGFGGIGGGGGYFSLGPARLPASAGSALAVNQMSGSSAAVSTSQAELIKTIKTTISPEIWDEQGGPATIAKLGNAFIISADEDTHDQIDALLNLFRKRWGTLRTISIRAWWHWMRASPRCSTHEEASQSGSHRRSMFKARGMTDLKSPPPRSRWNLPSSTQAPLAGALMKPPALSYRLEMPALSQRAST